MSTTDMIDTEIKDMIAEMTRDYKSMFTSADEKDRIIKRIAMLRQSMNANNPE